MRRRSSAAVFPTWCGAHELGLNLNVIKMTVSRIRCVIRLGDVEKVWTESDDIAVTA